MAMPQPRAIHPFFQKDFGTPARSTPKDTTEHAIPLASAQNDGARCSNSPVVDTPPLAMLEHDPNSSRRKRRKTKEPTDFGPIENFQGNDPDGDSVSRAQTSSVGPSTPPAEAVGQIQETQSSGLQSTAAELPGSDPGNQTASNDLPERRYPKRKTLKVNPNGKLLSSPNASGVEDTRQKTRTQPSRSGARKAEDDEKKLLVMKYAEDGHGERIGRLIDDIISGRKRHGVPEPPVAKPENQPPRATHPFFLKKPARKADTAIPASRGGLDPTVEGPLVEGAQNGPVIRNTSNLGMSGRPEKPFSSFKQRFPKFPEAINPLWPPRDFIHVKGLDAVDNQLSNALNPLALSQKKAKMAAIRITDKENLLMSTYAEVQRSGSCQAGKVLRIPGRNVASGRVLQIAVAKQFSKSSIGVNPDNRASSKPCHPAIQKLSSSIQTSMTAFDRGEFENSLWAHKYGPSSAQEVLQPGREPLMLRDWLKHLMVSAVDTGKQCSERKAKQRDGNKKRAKKRKKAEELGGFIVSSESMDEVSDSREDELAGDVTVSKRTVSRSGDLGSGARVAGGKQQLSNVILLSGPSGCGKTASVYAVAKELDFEVFEINPGSRRSSRDLLERVGDMTQNHLVHNLNGRDDQPPNLDFQHSGNEAQQNKMRSFFKPMSNKKPNRREAENGADPKHTRNQKQSLILLEEADLLFEEDKQFWSGVMSLISQSRRPIVITCNDESLIPLEDISFYAILRYRAPPQELAVDYLLLVAANEGHLLKRDAVEDLYAVYRKDLRKAVTDLSFWCQMGIGSEKSGLDWIINRSPPGSDIDQHGDPLRVISLNAYQHFMGWFSRDMMLGNNLNSEIESIQESFYWWQLSIQNSENMTGSSPLQASHTKPQPLASNPNDERLKELRRASEYVDLRSDLDILCSSCSIGQEQDIVDVSIPPISEKQRASYIEGYPLLHADLEPDYTSLSAFIGSTFEVLMRKVTHPVTQLDAESSQASQVLANASKSNVAGLSAADALAAFEPIMQANYVFPLPTGRLAPAFENGNGPLFEDLAPYVRGIVAFDLRLEKYRRRLSGLLSQGSTGNKRMRTTRASRAALEGSDKSSTRKERWFPPGTSPSRILATGGQGWQDLLHQQGYFAVGPVADTMRGDGDNHSSESSGEGGI